MPKERRTSTRRHALALMALTWITVAAGPAPDARVVAIAGTVEIGRGEPAHWQPARSGDALAPADRIRTGHDGRAELALDGATLRVYANSLLRLPAVRDERLQLDRGDSLFEVQRPQPTHRFEVETPEAIVSVKGTRFSVSTALGVGVGVSVFRGRVGVTGAAFPPDLILGAGFRAAAGPDGSFALHAIDGADPWDAWALGTPLPERLAAPPAPAAAAAGADSRARVAVHPASAADPVPVDVLAPVRAEPALTLGRIEAFPRPRAASAASPSSRAGAAPGLALEASAGRSGAIAHPQTAVGGSEPGAPGSEVLEILEDPGGILP